MANANEVKIMLSVMGASNVSTAFRGLAGDTQKLNHVMGQASNLFAFLGNTQLAMVASQAGILSNAISKLGGAFGKLGFLRGGALGLGVLAAGVAVNQVVDQIKSSEKEVERVRELQNANNGLARSLQDTLNARIKEGSVSKERAAELQAQIELIERLSSLPIKPKSEGFFKELFLNMTQPGRNLTVGPRLGLGELGGLPAQTAQEINAIPKQDVSGVIASHKALARVRAEATAEVAKAEIERDLDANEQAFATKQIQLEQYLSRKFKLTFDHSVAELQSIERQEFEARARLTSSDQEEKNKALAELATLDAQKKTIAIQFEQALTGIGADGIRERERLQDAALRRDIERLRELQLERQIVARQVAADAGLLGLQNQLRPTGAGIDNERDLRIANTIAGADAERQAATVVHQQRLLEIDRLSRDADVTEEQRRAMVEQAEAIHQQNLTTIEREAVLQRTQLEVEAEQKKKALRDAQLTGVQTMFTDMAIAAKAYGKEGFLAYKAFAIAAATVETYKSAVAAYSATVGIPYVGPFIAPIAAGAAIAAGMANISQIAAQSYAVGGYTGAGGKYEPAGMVHRDEFVMNSETVGRVGIGALQAIQDGDLEPSGGGGSVSIALVDNGRDARRFLESREGRQLIIDTISRQRGEV